MRRKHRQYKLKLRRGIWRRYFSDSYDPITHSRFQKNDVVVKCERCDNIFLADHLREDNKCPFNPNHEFLSSRVLDARNRKLIVLQSSHGKKTKSLPKIWGSQWIHSLGVVALIVIMALIVANQQYSGECETFDGSLSVIVKQIKKPVSLNLWERLHMGEIRFDKPVSGMLEKDAHRLRQIFSGLFTNSFHNLVGITKHYGFKDFQWKSEHLQWLSDIYARLKRMMYLLQTIELKQWFSF